jgi:hypothetical protein
MKTVSDEILTPIEPPFGLDRISPGPSVDIPQYAVNERSPSLTASQELPIDDLILSPCRDSLNPPQKPRVHSGIDNEDSEVERLKSLVGSLIEEMSGKNVRPSWCLFLVVTVIC